MRDEYNFDAPARSPRESDRKVRPITPNDAGRLVEFFRTLYAETDFMLFEPGEFQVSEAQQRARLEESARSRASVMFGYEIEEKLVGVVIGNRGFARRTRHSLYVVIGVLQAWVGQGVGRALLDALEAWARSNGLHRLELSVDVDNARAIRLYENFGFEREGRKRHSRKLGERYSDEYYMSKLL